MDFAVDRDRSNIKHLAASGRYAAMSWPSDKSYNLCLYVGVGGLPCSKGLLFRFRCFSLSLFFSPSFSCILLHKLQTGCRSSQRVTVGGKPAAREKIPSSATQVLQAVLATLPHFCHLSGYCNWGRGRKRGMQVFKVRVP